MNYFFDTEFIEGFHKPLFGKRRHHIDLISIGIVAGDGRTYEAVSNEYRHKDADAWVRNNVIVPLYTSKIPGFRRQWIYTDNFQNHIGKSNATIAREIYEFTDAGLHMLDERAIPDDFKRQHNVYDSDAIYTQPTFIGYYCDYDWVLLCSLFGRMIELPNGYPKYCIDVKQILDEVAVKWWQFKNPNELYFPHMLPVALQFLKQSTKYPENKKEHDDYDCWHNEICPISWWYR